MLLEFELMLQVLQSLLNGPSISIISFLIILVPFA